MNVPMSWLKTYVDIDCTTKEYIDAITLSGTKVETVELIGNEISKVVVGKITVMEKHPQADKLFVLKVDTGESGILQIITGATNVFVGALVPVALDGATLANGQVIKNGEIRGIESQGMLCSIEELGHSRQDYPEAPENGIYIFSEKADSNSNIEIPLGADAASLLELRDEVVEYEITSNRADCFSVVGIAREAAATFNKRFNYPEINVEEKIAGPISEWIDVEILNPELCPRYACRVIKNVKIEPSPQWLRHRLAASGVRPINNIVDITNYVMLELGQPMHAFDIDHIDESKIIVRNAKEGEVFTTLDGTERKLDPSMLVIADCNKAVAIAGVMGGENSKVTGQASAILFESANFNGPNIRTSSKKLGLRTDASSRYEKGLDPNLAWDALNRAAQLVEELGCGEVVKGICDCYPNKREPNVIDFCPESINKLLGTEIPAEEMVRMLNRLEITVSGDKATAPTYRPDMECLADLAEEVARIYGYDKIDAVITSGTPTVGKRTREQAIEELIRSTMVFLGLCEAMNYSFESPKVFDKLNIPADSSLRKTVTILNPLGEDYSIMRTTALNGMLQSLSTNYNRKNESAGLFELSKVYIPSASLTEQPDEPKLLTIGFYGGSSGPNRDFYDAKGIVEELLNVLGITGVDFLQEKNLNHMHPGRCARIQWAEESVTAENTTERKEALGYVGEVHPTVASRYDIDAKVYLAVLQVSALIENADLSRRYQPLPKYPAMERDIALKVIDQLQVRDIEKAIKEKGGTILEQIRLFDVYKGSQIQEGYKSVAFNLTFRDRQRTLKEEEVNKVIQEILENIKEKLDVQLR